MNKDLLIAALLTAVGFSVVVLLAVSGVPVAPVLVVGLGAALLFVLLWFFGACLPLRRFVPLKQRFGFNVVPGDPNLLTGMWQGRKVRIQYHQASKRHRGEPRLTIRMLHDCGFLPGVVFRREDLFHRLVKAIGLSKETQAGDRLFDNEVYVESEDDAAVPPLLAREELRLQVLALLDIPQTVITVDAEAVGIMIRGHFGWSKYFKPDRVQDVLDHLSTIASVIAETPRSSLQAFEQAQASDLSESRTLSERLKLLRHPARLAIFSASLSMFLGPALFFWGTRYQPVAWRLHLYALALSCVCFLVYAPLAFSFARGHSRSHQMFFIFMFAALVGFPTFWVGGLKVVNGLFDRQPPVAVEAHIARRLSKGTRLELFVDHYDKSGIVSVAVPPQLYRTSRPGQSTRLLLSPGALGEPWVVGVPR